MQLKSQKSKFNGDYANTLQAFVNCENESKLFVTSITEISKLVRLRYLYTKSLEVPPENSICVLYTEHRRLQMVIFCPFNRLAFWSLLTFVNYHLLKMSSRPNCLFVLSGAIEGDLHGDFRVNIYLSVNICKNSELIGIMRPRHLENINVCNYRPLDGACLITDRH